MPASKEHRPQPQDLQPPGERLVQDTAAAIARLRAGAARMHAAAVHATGSAGSPLVPQVGSAGSVGEPGG